MYENKEKEILSDQEESWPPRQEEYFKSPKDRLTEKKINAFFIGTTMVSVAIFSLAMALVYVGRQGLAPKTAGDSTQAPSRAVLSQNQLASPTVSSEHVTPPGGVTLPVVWGDMGVKLTQAGVINADRLKALYANRGGMTPEMKQLLEGGQNGNLKITPDNSGYLLNVLWAFGLGQKSSVLDNGPMHGKQYGNPGQFASTGGWTMASGDAMSHYSKHNFVNLTDDQKAQVARVAKNIYRPCCGNSTYFPDCNHGMAMLGLVELMASQGVSEYDMYQAALAVNSYWFPDTYDTIAEYLKYQGTDWAHVDAKTVLGESYSSGAGFRNVQAAVSQSRSKTSQPAAGSGAAAPRSSGGCGV